MDIAYNQHSNAARRKNRSTTNLNHLTLVPLTSKLPLTDHDDLPDPVAASSQTLSMSYLQGKSAPTTPRLLSRSPVAGTRSHSHTRGTSVPFAGLPKSKSATYLTANGRGHGTRGSTSGTVSPNGTSRRRRGDEPPLSARDRSDTDWLLRAGALISAETRESKGQAWLVSRASSTSLTAPPRDADEVLEHELAREREWASCHASRRGSIATADDERGGGSSPSHSRFGSRSQSRVGSRGGQAMWSPMEQRRSIDGYFPEEQEALVDEDHTAAGPDFVNLDQKLELEAYELDTAVEDEAHVRRLVKHGNGSVGAWFGNVLGFQLFSVEENEEEEEEDDEEDGGNNDDEDGGSGESDIVRDGNSALGGEKWKSSARQFEGVTKPLVEERIPPPKADEGGWQDAAWLLSVASRVLL